LHGQAALRYTGVMRCLALIPLLLLVAAPPSRAAVPLIFRDQARGLREAQLLDYFKLIKRYDPSKPYRIAAVDLNGDGVEEWIFKQYPTPSCESNADCALFIGGLSEGEIILLGEMRGGKIGVSDEKQYGVRKLLVYNEKSNDFAYQTYVWKPVDQAFGPE
jgi:hypothetical protein